MIRRHELWLWRGRVSCLEQGSPHPTRPTLVLVHGLLGTADIFRPLLEALPADWHALAINLPGAGRSERHPELRVTLASASLCVGEILDALQLDRPVLVGHSHGGAVGLHLGASAPERLRALVLLAPAHPYFREADNLIRFYLSPMGVAFAHTIPWYPAFVQGMGLRRMAGPLRWDARGRLQPYRENLRTKGTIRHLLRLLRTWHTDMDELRHLLETPLPLPTLLLWGDHDGAVPLSTAAMLGRHLQSAELKVLTGVGHLPAEEQPEVCAALIVDWCERLP